MNEVKIHVKAEDHASGAMAGIGKKVEVEAKRSFLKSGGHAGAAFAAGFIKTITFGMVGSGFAQSAVKMMPQMAHIGGALGAGLAAGLVMKAVSAVQAALPLALGAGILAGPIIWAIKRQIKGTEDLKKNKQQISALEDQLLAKDKQINAIADRIEHSKGKAKQTAERQLEIQKQNRREMEGEWEALQKQRSTLEKLTQPLKALKRHAVSFMDTITKPVEPYLFKAMKIVGSRLDEWAPKVKNAMKQLAPVLLPFTSGVLTGIENFFKAIGKQMPSIKSGMNAWGDNFGKVGKALGEMVAGIMRDPEGTRKAVEGLVSDIGSLAKTAGDAIHAISSFTRAYDKFARTIDKFENSTSGKHKGGILGDLGASAEGAIRSAGKAIQSGWNRLGRWIASSASKLKDKFVSTIKDMWHEAGASFKRDSGQVVGDVKHFVSRVVAAIRSLPGKARSAIGSLSSRIGSEVNQARSAAVSRARALVSGAVAILRQLPGRARAAISSIRSRIVSAFSGAGSWLVSSGKAIIRGLISGIKSMASAAGSAAADVVRGAIARAKSLIPGRASGGNVSSTAAGGGARGGQVLVGEQGPEIVDLPFGSHVNSNADSRRIGMGGGGGGNVHFHFHGPVYGDHNALKRALVDMKRRGELDVVMR